MDVEIYQSDDGRLKTARYEKRGGKAFALAERTVKGTLITEFNEDGNVVNQLYSEKKDHAKELAKYVGAEDSRPKKAGAYEKVEIKAKCKECGSVGLVRELDSFKPEWIVDVPVVPIFVCKNCRKKHFSLTEEYLRALVGNNKELFGQDELAEMNKDPDGSLKEMQEYIIRIFASKKISKIEK